MAVNVSPAQLSDEHFVEMVSEAVERAGIDYSDLELEITEGQVVEYLPLIEKAFKALNAKGVRIAIDDFGTGYSALAYLTRLHWSTVKIDRAFLADIPHESNAGRIVAAIVAMAGELGLQVTAEGVETEAQYRFLSEAGCHFGQGFGYARPQPAADFLRLLQDARGNRLDDTTNQSRDSENDVFPYQCRPVRCAKTWERPLLLGVPKVQGV